MRRCLHLLVALVVLTTVAVSAQISWPTPVAASPLPCSERDPLSAGYAQSLGNSYPGRGFSAEVYDSATGCVYDLNPGQQMTTASVVKLEIMSGVLLRAQEQGRDLTAEERSLIEPMITQSANDPASTLFNRLGGAAGMDQLSQTFGMNNTTSSSTWGLTSTTAADQVHLIRQVLAGEFGPLSAPYRDDARFYTGNVIPEQRWGVSASVPAGFSSFQKNGFAPSPCCGWRLNSVGWVERPDGTGWAMAIFSDGWSTEGQGIAAVDAIGDHINRTVVGSPFGQADSIGDTGAGRVRVAGWAADPSDSAPIDVHLFVDGAYRGAAAANGNRPDVAAAYPGYGSAHGFDAIVSVPDGTHVVCVEAVNNGPPAPNSLLRCSSVTVRLSPFGQIDQLTFVPGGLRVSGWAIDPDTPNPIDVHVYVGAAGFNTGPADDSRPDVANAYPGFGPSHGFDVTIPWTTPGMTSICVYGINVGAGTNTTLGCPVLDVGGPFGSIDIVSSAPDHLRVRGWAIDPDTPNPIDVQLFVNGTALNTTTANVSRPDVGGAYPGFGSNHGYDALVPYTGGGPLIVCATGINAGPNRANRQLGCKPFDRPDAPFGMLDGLTFAPGGIRVSGWALDPDTAAPIEVHVYVGAAGFNTGPADDSRPDVANAYPGFGPSHGFDTVIPWTTPGMTSICVYAINATFAPPHMLLGCRQLDIGAPFGNFDIAKKVSGGIRVAGWAIDPDTSNPIDVHIYVNGTFVNGSGFNIGSANDSRPDVASAYPGFGANHGFDTVIPWNSSGSVTVCAYAINVGAADANPLLGCRGMITQTPERGMEGAPDG